MLWRKIQHHQLIYSFVAFLFFSFLFSVGSSQDSYATSVTCQYTNSSVPNYSQSYIDVSFTSCSSFNSNLRYLSFDNAVVNLSSNPSGGYFIFSGGQTYYRINQSSTSYSISEPDNVFSFYFYNSPNYNQSNYVRLFHGTGSRITSYDITITFYDSISSSEPCPEPEEPDCPEPETPYGDKLDDIKKAIYVCGAILIMLYFFFCIYKIIVKDGGSR